MPPLPEREHRSCGCREFRGKPFMPLFDASPVELNLFFVFLGINLQFSASPSLPFSPERGEGKMKKRVCIVAVIGTSVNEGSPPRLLLFKCSPLPCMPYSRGTLFLSKLPSFSPALSLRSPSLHALPFILSPARLPRGPLSSRSPSPLLPLLFSSFCLFLSSFFFFILNSASVFKGWNEQRSWFI